VLRRLLDRVESQFTGKGRLAYFFALYEAIDTFFYTPKKVTEKLVHIRDTLDYKRLMMIVVVALTPVTLMAMYNTGYQANLAYADVGVSVGQAEGGRADVLRWLGLGVDPASVLDCFVLGAMYFLPVYVVCMAVGGVWELIFAFVRKHEVNEGFLVTGLLFPLTLPPTIPWWQVAVGISFGVVIGKEIFGGTGKNFLNPALTARAFLFFAYPGQIIGDTVWIAGPDGYTGATSLGIVATQGMEAVTDTFGQWAGWWDSFVGFIPGSMGETSTLGCLFGAAVLIFTGIGSWRIMLSMVTGAAVASVLLFMMGPAVMGLATAPAFQMPPHWHLVVGGFAFGTVFMATDPVSASMTRTGQWYYGSLIGVAVMMVRVVNPAYPEGAMLAILLGNTFAPTIDYYVVKANIRRRALRHA